jgi:hypothetical protein
MTCQPQSVAKFRHNHIVSRSQVRLFANDEDVVECHLSDGRTKLLGARHVAVRKNFYTASLPDGSTSTAFEQSMGVVERGAISILREIDANWPPSLKERHRLSEYLALQAIRSPAYRYSFETLRGENVPGYAASLSAEKRADFEAQVLSDQFRLETMATQIAKMGTLLGSMHWSLIRFPTPRVLGSDHPLSPVPLLDADGAPIAAIPVTGFANTIEFRFPISSNRVLLLCWRDHEDDFPVFDGRLHHVKSVNAATRAQAEEHWFHRPGVSTPCASGPLLPLSFELFDDYELEDAIESTRRRKAEATIEELIESGENSKMSLLTVTKAEPESVIVRR